MAAKVAIVIPTYNRASQFRRALKSVFEQTYQDYKVYVVGDHCVDKTEQVIKEFKDDRLVWINLPENTGLGGAIPRNTAIQMSTELYIAYLDDDNYWYPKHLELLVPLLESDKTLGFVLSAIENRDKLDPDKVTMIRDISQPRQMRRGMVDTSAILHHRKLINRLGLWKTIVEIGYFHDWELVKRWVEGGIKWKAHSEPTIVFMNVPRRRKAEFNEAAYVRYINELARKNKIYFPTRDE